jgi:hypothetical protein
MHVRWPPTPERMRPRRPSAVDAMRLRRALVAASAAALLAACGSTRTLPPPAAPAASPPLDTRPAGRPLSSDAAARAPRPAAALHARARPHRDLALDPRERVLRLRDTRTGRVLARAPAGVGPTHVATAGRFAYVVDTRGGALLVYTTRPHLEPVRRVYLPGSPYGLAVDAKRRRLWITLTARNRLVELPAHGRPHVLRELPTVRRPVAVAVGSGGGPVVVTGRRPGRAPVLQALDPDRVRDR